MRPAIPFAVMCAAFASGRSDQRATAPTLSLATIGADRGCFAIEGVAAHKPMAPHRGRVSRASLFIPERWNYDRPRHTDRFEKNAP